MGGAGPPAGVQPVPVRFRGPVPAQRPGERHAGLGDRRGAETAGPLGAAAGSLLCAAALAALEPWFLLAAGAGYLSFLSYVRTAKREFGGTTGDLSGWFLQLCELSSLAGLVLAQRLEVLL